MRRVLSLLGLVGLAVAGAMFGGSARAVSLVDSLTAVPPAPITATADTACGQTYCAFVSYAFSATGGVPPYRFTCNLPSGLFTVGAHNVSCIAQDAANDSSPPAGFEVTINPPSTDTTTTTTTTTTTPTTTTAPTTTTTPTTTTAPTTTTSPPSSNSGNTGSSGSSEGSGAAGSNSSASSTNSSAGTTTTTASHATGASAKPSPTRETLSAVSITGLHSVGLRTRTPSLLFIAKASNATKVKLTLYGPAGKRLARWNLELKKGSHHLRVALPRKQGRLAGDTLQVNWSNRSKPLTFIFA